MADKVSSGSKKNTLLRVSFILYIISVCAFLLLLFDTVSYSGGLAKFTLEGADFYANCLRFIADLLILIGFWKTRRNGLLTAGFLINVIPQAFDLLIHFNGMKETMINCLAFVATLFLIVFYFIMTGLTVAGKAKNEAYLFAKIAVLISVFFWVISDIANLAASGMQGIFTAVFLGIDFMQIVTLGLWGILLPNYLKRTSETV